jgi:L-2-hydroxyglutarate oxidase LhgO
MAATKVDSIVIGAGVIGLAIARSLAKRGRDVLILDKASFIGSETSARNSQVIHSGIYYPQHSLKAQLCVQGNRMMYEYCEERNIPFHRCGKLIVATSDEQLPTIHQLHQQAQRNGVTDTKIISKTEVQDMEPLVASCGALYSPSTGVVDAHAFMTRLLADAEADGATLALRTKVEDARIDRDGSVSLMAGNMWITSKYVVNASGLWADQIGKLIHTNPRATQGSPYTLEWQPPRQYYCKGTYFQLQSATQPFRRLIYPVPDPRGGLGVHATIDLAGRVKFGPDIEWMDAREAEDPDSFDYTPDPARANSFYESIRTYFPSLAEKSLEVDYTGVRPKLSHPTLQATTALNQDFVIATKKDHGIRGLVHLFGMESPGLTCSLALAEHVCDELLSN